MIPTLPEFKRGDTFLLSCVHKVDGTPTSVTGYEISAQIRRSPGSLVAALETTLADQTALPGVFYLAPVSADTSTWPTENLQVDIRILNGGIVRHTETLLIPVVRSVTQ